MRVQEERCARAVDSAGAQRLSQRWRGVAAGCGSDDNSSSGGGSASTSGGGGKAEKVAVLLPDTKSSVRWETLDRPLLKKAFDSAGVQSEIQNAEGDKSAQQQQAEQAITNGAKVLLLVDLDSGSGAAIEANAKSHGVKVIDYDRLTLKGDADYYVSFDNEKVGKLQGEGLVKCLADSGAAKPDVAELNGSPTDNNATLFKQGYNSVLDPKYKAGECDEGRRPVRARLGQPEGADDLRADAAEEQQQDRRRARGQRRPRQRGRSRRSRQRKLKQIPVTGQDATPQGIQHILAGDQCMTVYKADQEGGRRGRRSSRSRWPRARSPRPACNGKSDDGTAQVPSVLLDPGRRHQGQHQGHRIKDGFPKKARLCAGKFADACTKAGI